MARAPEKSPARNRPEPRTGPHRPLLVTEEDLIARLLASTMGLPRLCVFKVCRRRKRCFGPDIACLKHHRGLARKRMRAAVARLTRPEPSPSR